MAKPPASPPSSDITGVNEDRLRVDRPGNVDTDDNEQIERGNDQAKGRPESDSGSEAIGD
ncbi:hypothetical protein [Sphingomonas montana]|uniref:hypothetical protein n=1 Tax=Sphingomonas montana TaxID=1843236 RepID=UPI00096EC90A|nr:hypothetical protein [Sphingomonas montana]